MKYLIAFALSFLFLAQAHAEPLTPELCGTGLTAFCSNAAPDISLLTYSPSGGRISVTIHGVLFVSAPYSATDLGATVYAPDGTWKEVTTVWATWRTCTRTGRGQSCLTHFELKSGSVE